jgi:hexokinase
MPQDMCVLHAGLMLVEKLMSGLYMGDCTRRLLLSFASDAQLFGGHVPGPLAEKGSFTTAGKDPPEACVASHWSD